MNKQTGFTLLELMMATFVVSILMVGIAALFTYVFQTYSFTFEQSKTLDETRNKLSRIVPELREARTSEDGAYVLQQADDQEIMFYSDVDNDGRIERVRYYLVDTTLYRGVIEPADQPPAYDSSTETTTIISEAVTNGSEPLFTYYNRDWPADTTNNPLAPSLRLLQTKLVQIHLRVNTNPNYIEDFEITTLVAIRNLLSEE